MNWRIWRWITMMVSAVTALALLGITESLIGYGLNTIVISQITVKHILAIANIVSFYALWKAL